MDTKEKAIKIVNMTLDWIYYELGLYEDESITEKELLTRLVIRGLYHKYHDFEKVNKTLQSELNKTK